MAETGFSDSVGVGEKHRGSDGATEFRRQETPLKAGALQEAIFNSANFSSIDSREFRVRAGGSLAHVPVVIISGVADDLDLMRGASAVLQKPIHRAQLKMSLVKLGLQPVKERTHTVLVVDDDPKAVEVIAACLPAPAYAVVRAYGGAVRRALPHRQKDT